VLSGRKHLLTAALEVGMSQHIEIVARTGQRCPETGRWEVVGAPSTVALIAKHRTMPPYRNAGVVWRLRSDI
jgi:hypothetical protein